MNNIDLIRMAVQNLWRRKLRTFLTVLGVMIGTSSIVVMLSLGFGMSQSLEDQISSWGSLTHINVMEGHGANIGDMRGAPKSAKLDKAAVGNLQKIPHVDAVNATIQTFGTIKAGRNETSGSIIGVNPDIMESFGYEVQEGRLLNHNDKLSMVFGGEMGNNFYDPKSRVYREINVDVMTDRLKLVLGDNFSGEDPNSKPPKEHPIKVVGVFPPGDFSTDYSIFMPIDELRKLMDEAKKANTESGNRQQAREKSNEYSNIIVKVDDVDNVIDVQNTIKEMGFEADSLTDQLDSFKQQSFMIQAILGGIGAISLIVAAIGITNTMIMSIYERTKEIGVMKVIGASIKDIKRLFLLEAGIIGLLGGLVGLIFSYLISFGLNTLGAGFMESMGFDSQSGISIIPIPLALGAMAFSVLIGLVAGYFPAKRAMNLSALEAIRTE